MYVLCVLLGVRGTYQGLTATVLKQGTNQAIRFYVMTSLRNWYKGNKPHIVILMFSNKNTFILTLLLFTVVTYI